MYIITLYLSISIRNMSFYKYLVLKNKKCFIVILDELTLYYIYLI